MVAWLLAPRRCPGRLSQGLPHWGATDPTPLIPMANEQPGTAPSLSAQDHAQANQPIKGFSQQNPHIELAIRNLPHSDADFVSLTAAFQKDDVEETATVAFTEYEKEILLNSIVSSFDKHCGVASQWDDNPGATGHAINLIRLMHKLGHNYFEIGDGEEN